MYKNRISRATTTITPNSHPQFFIRGSEIEFARVDYIESVCQVLIESRFGPDFVYQMMDNPSELPELEPFALCDLSDDGEEMMPWYAISRLGRNTQASCLRSDKFSGTHDRRAKQMRLNATPNALNSTSAFPPNQGRGSP